MQSSPASLVLCAENFISMQSITCRQLRMLPTSAPTRGPPRVALAAARPRSAASACRSTDRRFQNPRGGGGVPCSKSYMCTARMRTRSSAHARVPAFGDTHFCACARAHVERTADSGCRRQGTPATTRPPAAAALRPVLMFTSSSSGSPSSVRMQKRH